MNRAATTLLFIALTVISGCASPPEPSARNAGSESIVARFNALKGSEAECRSDFVNGYRKSTYDHCVATGGGDGIAGGCDHVARTVGDDVLEQAILACNN